MKEWFSRSGEELRLFSEFELDLLDREDLLDFVSEERILSEDFFSTSWPCLDLEKT